MTQWFESPAYEDLRIGAGRRGVGCWGVVFFCVWPGVKNRWEGNTEE